MNVLTARGRLIVGQVVGSSNSKGEKPPTAVPTRQRSSDGVPTFGNRSTADDPGLGWSATVSAGTREPRFVYVYRDFRDLCYPAATFDLIASSISIHHLTSAEKAELFGKRHRWLKPLGVFTYADQFRGATDDLYSLHVTNWKRESLAAGASEDEFEMWMTHQRECNHHDTLGDQLNWLSEAGFAMVDCTRRYLLWSVIGARKAAGS